MRTRLALLAAALLATILTVPVGAAAPVPSVTPQSKAKIDGSVTRSYTVPTRDGPLYLEVVHPTSGGQLLRANAILTLSPYSALGRNGDASSWVPQGYARMYADVIGTGNSGGCYDYGGGREKRSGHDLVEWIARQPWSLGRVGMIGGSYDGTTANATATTRPKGLTTIVPEAAISRWYDYAYAGGIRYTDSNEELGKEGALAASDEGVDTPLAFDFGLAVPPPTDATDPHWAERVQATMVLCDELTHTQHGYSLTPDYDAFWRDRDYAAHASDITIPVLVAHNWGDWNVKQDTGLRMWHALTRSKDKRLFLGTRWSGHGTPKGSYSATVHAWMDRWVGGVDNRIEQTLPLVTSQTSSSAGPGDFLAGPTPQTTDLVMRSTASYGLTTSQADGGSTGQLPITGAGTESGALLSQTPGVLGGRVLLVSAPLTRDARLFGSPVIRTTIDSGRTWLTLTPAVIDLDPAAAPRLAVTRGWLDTRYEHGLDAARPGPAGVRTDTVVAMPMDYTFRKGHRLGLVVQNETVEWTIAKPYEGACATCSTYALQLGAGTSVTLPVTGSIHGLF